MEDKISLIYEAKDARAFIQSAKDSEIALRRQVRSLKESELAIRAEIQALKGVITPNRQLITEKQRLLQQNRLNAAQTQQLIASLKLEQAALKQTATGTGVLNTEMKGLGATAKSLVAPLAGVFAVFSAGKILMTADAFNQLQARIKGSLSDATEFDAIFKKLIDSSNRSGTALDAVGQAFVRLRPAAENLGVTNDQLIKFNETFAKMGSLAGATSEEIKNTMIQLSQGLASGALRGDELRSVMEQMPQVARTIADSMGIPFEKFKKAAEDGKITADQVFKAIISQADKVDDAFSKLPPSIERAFNRLGNVITVVMGRVNKAIEVTDNFAKSINDLAIGMEKGGQKSAYMESILKDLAGTFNSLMGTIRELVNLTSDPLLMFFSQVATGARVAAFGIESLMLNLRELQIRNKYFRKSLGPNNDAQAQKESDAEIKALYDESAARNRDLLEGLGLIGKRYTGPLNINPDRNKPARGIRSIATEGKTKKGKSASTLDRERIENVSRDFQHQIEQAQAKAGLEIAQMGPFANKEDILQKQLLAEQNTAAILNRELIKLHSTSVKTADGQRALKEESAKVQDEIVKQAKSVQEAKNALEEYKAQIAFQDSQRQRELSAMASSDIHDREIAGAQEATKNLEEQYEQRKLKINEFYDSVNAEIDSELKAEKGAYDAKIKLIDQEIEARKKLNDIEGIKDLEVKKTEAYYAYGKAEDDIKARVDQVQRDRVRDLGAAARQFGDSLESEVSDALVDVFTGNDPLNAAKKFVKRLYTLMVGSIADAIAAGFRNSTAFQAISNWFGSLLNGISGVAGAPKQQLTNLGAEALDFSDLVGKQGTVQTGSGTVLQASLSGGKSAVNGSKFASAAAVALPLAIAGYSATKAIQSKGSVGMKYLRFIDPLGFRKLFGIDNGPTPQQQRATYQQNKLAPFLDKVVSGADQNNLIDLQARFYQAARGMKGNGSNGMRMKQDAMRQIMQMIDQRKKTIDEFIKDITRQNEQLADEIQLADAKPFERAAMERQIAIKQIEFDTKALLEQYKDSEQAKTKILEQESLKRKQLGQQETEDFKSKTQTLRDLLIQRDDVANANVFQRKRSAEQVKAENLSKLDAQIKDAAAELKGMMNAGIGGDSLGSAQIMNAVNTLNQSFNLNVTINESNDPNASNEAVTRAVENLMRKGFGANVA